MIAIFLSNSSSLFVNTYAQSIIGYNESTITVKSEKTHCGSRELEDPSVQTIGEENIIEKAMAGSQVLVETSVASNCELDDYPILILLEVRDSEGLTAYFAYQNVTMSQGERATVGFSWFEDRVGDYELRIVSHACLRCSGDFGLIRVHDFIIE